MIPLRLQIKNFMSYGEGVPPLELSGVRLACLSGDNGNGKTALLDAITWALFGETRASSEDDVIRLGASDTRVLLDFAVDGVKYRVHKARGKRGGAIWELQIWQEDGSTRSLSGTNMSETKARIKSLLRMDYKTFLASGYLAQGRADEFARASVADRKKVLADILDLSRYERLEQMAKEKRADAEARELDAEREIRSIDAELLNEDGYAISLEDAQKRQAALEDEMARLQAEYESLLVQLQRLEESEEKAREYEARSREIVDEIAQNARALQELEKRIAQAETVLNRRAEIEAAYNALITVQERIGPLEQRYAQVLELEREAHSLEKQIRDEHDTLDRERYRLDCDVTGLEQEARDLVLCDAEVTRLEDEIARYGDPEARRRTAEDERAKADDILLTRKAEHGALRAQMDGLQKRINALRASDASLCEYCGQPLPPAKRRQAVQDAEADMAALQEQQESVAALGREARQRSDRLRQDAERAQTELRAISQLEAQRTLAAQQQLRLTERTKTLPDLRRRRDGFARRIAARDYAPEAQERLMQVSAQREKMERVAEELAAARAEREAHRDAERQLLHLQAAEQIRETEPPRADELRAQIARREAQIEKAKKVVADIRARTAALPTLRREQSEAAARISQTQSAAQATQREIGQYTSRLEHCAHLKGERVRREAERKASAKQKDLYKELVGAFGKKGVQALIIENALPEIQDQANLLLGRMTDGGMQIQLLTQREAKSKTATGAIETLDIIISDDMGTRPYEMYSGGEAFRINFALRVALSRLLARRAGAPLQTLILDEGFGTQDPRGREAIVDALHAIADDFALILVITHIEELKETFPTRIEVVKGPNGSTFTVA